MRIHDDAADARHFAALLKPAKAMSNKIIPTLQAVVDSNPAADGNDKVIETHEQAGQFKAW